MNEETLEYRDELYGYIERDSHEFAVFSEQSFFEFAKDLLSEAGIMDDAEYFPFRSKSRGMRIDGVSWNELERTVRIIIVDFSNDISELSTLTNTMIKALTKNVINFLGKVSSHKFLDQLDPTDPGRSAADEINRHQEEVLKHRIVLISDRLLSKTFKLEQLPAVNGVDCSLEIWDVERLRQHDQSANEGDGFVVDIEKYESELRAIPANLLANGVSTYLAIMPGQLLSDIYGEFGQRLLESNVRTFLDFRAGTNRDMRMTLLTEPDNFFAFNNGITVTASSITTQTKGDQLFITSLENMQIVNGGQTTCAIYFSPRERGGIKGDEGTYSYRDIDLNKVFVQMKLSVVDDVEKSEEIKANIAEYSNSQNSIQKSDLVSNHPFHKSLEKRSRSQGMPAGDSGISTKWFYERVRGQYSTRKRKLSSRQLRNFEAEFPKKQVFTKTDMAKYENTWRLKPYIVKRGAQANLKVLGKEIVEEFKRDEAQFGAAFYLDLVSKMILFRQLDREILTADWYVEERGLKAEIVTYSIALLRFKLLEKELDIDLSSIYRRQKVPRQLLMRLVDLAQEVRWKITDFEFTGGVTNPSEFCKSEKGWNKVKTMDVDLSGLGSGQIVSKSELLEALQEKKELNNAANTVSSYEFVETRTSGEWRALAEHYAETYPSSHKNVKIPEMCAMFLQGGGSLPSEKQMDLARKLHEDAVIEGFEYVSLK